MANWRSCGEFFGGDVTGSLGTFLHYLISAYRARGLINKCGILWDAVKNPKITTAPYVFDLSVGDGGIRGGS